MTKKQDSFEKNGMLIFAISIFASGLNYLFQILSGRLLDTADYGQINSLFSIINILTVLGSALGLSITKHIAESNHEVGGNIKRILKHAMWIMPIVMIMMTIIILAINRTDLYTSIVTAVATYAMAVAFIFFSILQGKKMFTNVGIFNLIQPAFKFVVGIVLLLIGLRYQSIMYVMAIGAILAMIYGYRKSKNVIDFSANANNNEVKLIYKYFVFTFISTICLTIFNNIDILIIKQFFDETATGMYSSAALFGKIILYIPTALITMMVPLVAESKTKEEATSALKKTFAYSIILSGIACAGLYILRTFIIKLLMGEKFLEATEFVLPVCVMMLSLVCATVFINYLIAKGDKWFTTVVCMIFVAIALITVLLIHSTISQIIYTLATIYLVLFVILLIRTLFLNKRKD